MRAIATLLLFLLILSGCRAVTSEEEVYGRYLLRKPEATVELVLKKDQPYHETIRFPDGSSFVVTGRWRLEVAGGEGYLALDGCVDVAKELTPKSIGPLVNYGMATEWRFGKIILYVAVDDEKYFVRQDD